MSDEQSLRDDIAKAIHDGPSAILELATMKLAPHPFGKCKHKATYYGDADAILASLVIRRIQAKAWNEGYIAAEWNDEEVCKCDAWNMDECACGNYGNGHQMKRNPYGKDRP